MTIAVEYNELEEGIERITVTKIIGEYTVRVTQRYIYRHDMGSYKTVIERGGHIISVSNGPSGVTMGKVDESWCERELEEFIRHF
jgi:hypothetical protein